ncbi:MAG: UDP-N-acetylmuramoyl-L-alanyl-D-glutamate--2,6-diaminopimelate ligase [Desulfovibrionales bacterium]
MTDMTWSELLTRVSAGMMVRTDSREIQPGEAFAALPGSRVDGSTFIPEALARGAKLIIAKPGTPLPAGADAVLVTHPDPRKGLGELAAAYYRTQNCDMKLIGVTGTNGKTTVTHMIEHLLREGKMTPGIMGTISCRWPGQERASCLTTPDCWSIHQMLREMADAGVDAVCMEASSHALDQDRMAGLRFDAAVFTNLTQDHLDYHRTMEEYFAAKKKLFSGDGDLHRVVNIDDPYGARIAREHRPVLGVTLGGNGHRDFPVLRGRFHSAGKKGLSMSVDYGDRTWRIDSSMVGKHNGYNMLLALGTVISLGVEHDAAAALSRLPGVPGRLERVENARGLDVFVDYAHTPDALENVLSALRELDASRIVTVFGCGGERDAGKRPIMGRTVARYSDVAVLTSDNPRGEDPEAIMDQVEPGLATCPRVIRESDRKSAIALAIGEMQPGDVLLVAGKGHETYQQIGDRRIPFSDVQAIQEVLQ